MKLAIVIPAYNEEEAIGAIIERTLAAREHIIAHSPVSDVSITVVSDGSTDRTVRIASGYDGISLVVFERNRGYGAAIKRGFAEHPDADCVGFLDADGTCDPLFFADLCTALDNRGAAIALGSRLGPDSQMPRLRRVGNRMYAAMLSVLSNQVVSDTASGMRVIRRSALHRLYPLPDGLHFTPAMSARALLDERLPIAELPMSYRERVGESKLHVVRDGIRFLQTIIEMTLFCRPARVFLSLALACLVITVALAAHPVEMWLGEHRLEESMIYRLLFCSLLGSLGVMLLGALAVADALRGFNPDTAPRRTLVTRLLDEVFSMHGLACLAAVFGSIVVVLIGPGVWSWIIERQVHVHWSRVVLAGLLTFTVAQLVVTKILIAVIRVHVARMRFVSHATPAANVGPAKPTNEIPTGADIVLT